MQQTTKSSGIGNSFSIPQPEKKEDPKNFRTIFHHFLSMAQRKEKENPETFYAMLQLVTALLLQFIPHPSFTFFPFVLLYLLWRLNGVSRGLDNNDPFYRNTITSVIYSMFLWSVFKSFNAELFGGVLIAISLHCLLSLLSVPKESLQLKEENKKNVGVSLLILFVILFLGNLLTIFFGYVLYLISNEVGLLHEKNINSNMREGTEEKDEERAECNEQYFQEKISCIYKAWSNFFEFILQLLKIAFNNLFTLSKKFYANPKETAIQLSDSFTDSVRDISNSFVKKASGLNILTRVSQVFSSGNDNQETTSAPIL